MSKPTAGKMYTVTKYDTLYRIAGAAYGIPSRWRDIWEANQAQLKSGNPNLIYPGEVVFIPGLPELAPIEKDLPDKNFDEITLVIDDKEVTFETASVFRAMDTCADAFVITADYFDFPPYRYNKAQVYVGGKLVITGKVYTPEIILSEEREEIVLYGFGNTIDLVDSNLKAKFEQRNVSLKQVAETLVTGIKVVFDSPIDGIFKRVTADINETKFGHLSKLAAQKNSVVTSTNKGELLITQAKTDDKIGSITYGLPPFANASCKFDGRQRFGTYQAIRQTRSSRSKKAIAKDIRVPLARFKNVNISDAESGDLQKIADWQRSKQLVGSLGLSIPVDDWYAPNGSLWRENTILNVKAKKLGVPKGFDFIIRSVEYLLDESGRQTVLGLALPQMYTGEEVIEPWFQ